MLFAHLGVGSTQSSLRIGLLQPASQFGEPAQYDAPTIQHHWDRFPQLSLFEVPKAAILTRHSLCSFIAPHVSTGSCAENGVKPFYFNPDKEPVDDMENKLWFTNYTTKADGKVAGHGANDGLIRTVAQGKKDAVKSVMLVETKTNCESICIKSACVESLNLPGLGLWQLSTARLYLAGSCTLPP